MRVLTATLAFLLELCLLAAVAYWGYQATSDPVTRIGFAMAAALAVAVIWGMLLAPKSARRLPTTPRVLIEMALYAVGAVALAAAGQPEWGIVLAVAVIVRFVLGAVTRLDAEGL